MQSDFIHSLKIYFAFTVSHTFLPVLLLSHVIQSFGDSIMIVLYMMELGLTLIFIIFFLS
jgi:hypothetical protein